MHEYSFFFAYVEINMQLCVCVCCLEACCAYMVLSVVNDMLLQSSQFKDNGNSYQTSRHSSHLHRVLCQFLQQIRRADCWTLFKESKR